MDGLSRPKGQVDEDEGEADAPRRDEGEQGELLEATTAHRPTRW